MRVVIDDRARRHLRMAVPGMERAFYPHGHPQRGRLGEYARSFPTVEVNNAFYRLPEAATFNAWRCETPTGSSSGEGEPVPHRHPAPTESGRAGCPAHGPGGGVGRSARPGAAPAAPDAADRSRRARRILAQFPIGTRFAVEFRHASWYVDVTAELLTRNGAAFCIADSPRRQAPHWRTANWGYLRFHEGRSTPHPCYGRAALASWARRTAEIYGDASDVYAYFNNDSNACAPFNAATFVRSLHGLGLAASPGWRRFVARGNEPMLSMWQEVRSVQVAGDLDRLGDVDDGPQLRRDVVLEPDRDAMGPRLGRKDASPQRVLGCSPALLSSVVNSDASCPLPTGMSASVDGESSPSRSPTIARSRVLVGTERRPPLLEHQAQVAALPTARRECPGRPGGTSTRAAGPQRRAPRLSAGRAAPCGSGPARGSPQAAPSCTDGVVRCRSRPPSRSRLSARGT